MGLCGVTATNFRCFVETSIELDEASNLIVGANAAGKTSLLEAIAYLGRGKSFRGATVHQVVRHGEAEFVVQGRVQQERQDRRVGVRNGADGLEVRIDRQKQNSVASLAELLPLQIVDPEIHELVAGGPERRRRYLDWLLFHVEQGYLDDWRRFRRLLKQRNAALRTGEIRSLASWDRELVVAGEKLAEARHRILERARPVLLETATRLNVDADFVYRRGWPDDQNLEEALRGCRERDLAAGATQVGPHRDDVRLTFGKKAAKRLVSRGQQKLLACSMVLAATAVVQESIGQPLLLLLDDPAAELDSESLQRLLEAVADLGCQVVATALTSEGGLQSLPWRLFHVEQGQVQPA